jgi:hypothetical protein
MKEIVEDVYNVHPINNSDEAENNQREAMLVENGKVYIIPDNLCYESMDAARKEWTMW